MSTLLPTDKLPPDTTWTNGRLEQQPRARSICEQFGEIETLLRGVMESLGSMPLTMDTLGYAAGKVLALKERVCASTQRTEHAALKSWQVHVFDRETGAELQVISLRAPSMDAAEEMAVSKAALHLRGNPAQLEARRVHEVCGQCGNIQREDMR